MNNKKLRIALDVILILIGIVFLVFAIIDAKKAFAVNMNDPMIEEKI